MTIDALTVAAERAEAATMLALESRATPETVARLGMAATEIGGGVVLAVREDPSQYWSKAYCLGLDSPITDAVIGEVLDFYRANGNKVAVLQIAPIPVRDGLVWARMLMDGFGMPAELAPMVSNVLAEAGVTSFGAYAEDELVGSATLNVVDVAGGQRVGEFAAGCTLPDYQGRGAQSALIAARIKAAVAAGCGLLVSETGDEQPGEHNTSLHNLRRLGFRVLYKRQNWVWRG